MKFRTVALVGLCLALRSWCAAGDAGALDRARAALFENSDPDGARAAAAEVLKQEPANRAALFITMEAAALEADSAAELDAALRLCETKAKEPQVNIAAARILELAANTAQFRAIVPRLQALLADYTPQASDLRTALLAAAADGTPGIDARAVAHDSGLATDWRIAGPFGRFSNVDFDRRWPAELDRLSQPAYPGRVVEHFRFEDGRASLPDYFEREGVFYAASEVDAPAPGDWMFRVESSGTLELFVDGASVLLKDDRFRATPAIVARTLWLAAGWHRVLVKFIPAGAPFRVTLLPAREQNQKCAAGTTPEARYVAAAEKYWSGDYDGAIAQLESLLAQKETALADYLLAHAWSQVAPDSPERTALLEAALKLAPAALVAEYQLADEAYSDDRADEALTRVRRVVAARPDFAPAQELMSQIAMRLNWRAEANQALDARLRLHPSCSALEEAARFFNADAQYERARQAEARLQDCAPGSLAYAQALSASGRHAEAAIAAGVVAAAHPFNREALAVLTRELALAGETEAAHRAAQELLALAPNSESYRRVAASVESGGILDEDTPRARQFAATAFYAPYRRDASQVLQDTAERPFAGGSAVILLYDRVARLAADGSVAVYTHKLTRVLNRDGIERSGEVAVPADAAVLQLRTLKPDGSSAEPEPTRHKATVSMPALAPGDVIEQEYVQQFGDGIEEHQPAFQFIFGSFAAPVTYARFVVLWPASESARMRVVTSGLAPQSQTRTSGDTVATVWEQNDIPQSAEETAMPRSDTLPSVRVLYGDTWADVRDHYRDAAIAATRISSRVRQRAAALRGRTDEEKARELYGEVVTRVRPAGAWTGSGDTISAEDTLAGHAGNRTAALLALARAAGLRADLLLARDTGTRRPDAAQLEAYTRPLVRFRLAHGDQEVVVDAETEGMAFGALSPTIERRDALLILLETASVELAQNPIVSLPDTSATEQSVAEGDVSLDDAGGLEARISIRMGATRAAQMRSILAGIEPGQRQHFFEQLALRIFPGAAGASGEVRNEYDLERPLEILLTCRAPHFADLAAGAADIDQLVPALGLRKMYGAGFRRFPLYIDAPLYETASFRVHLPAHTVVRHHPADVLLKTGFGEYSVTFRQLGDRELEVRRAFRVPVQVVPPEQFPAFSKFSLQIDEAERQRITLQRDATMASEN
jgi:tetratricopeptide (TPR) repeat protein